MRPFSVDLDVLLMSVAPLASLLSQNPACEVNKELSTDRRERERNGIENGRVYDGI